MFRNLTDGPLPYDPPWEQEPLATRLAAVRSGHPRIAWLYERRDTSTFRYRCVNPSATLAAARPGMGTAWFERDDIPALLPEVPNLDALVICRYQYDAEVARLIARARAAGTRVIFDCDDLIFDTRHVHLILDTLDQPTDASLHWNFWFATIGRTGGTAWLCDRGIATNGFLAERLAEAMGGAPVGVVPNYLAPDQEMASRRLLHTKRRRGFRGDERVTVGYFSGTPTHNKDFAVAAPALARLLATDPSVDLRIVGFPPPNGPLAPFAERIEVVPLQDYCNLQRVIAEVEVNIAPLQDNVFTNCKSELKFFEAAVVGTWTVATPTFTFRRAIRDGVTGRLARAHEWDAALAEAVSLVRDPAHYAAIAEAAAAEAYATYGWDQQAQRILDAVGLD
jgi:glycosyltransferase involved in cell wall biosynthesis